jgi:TetR/AcrR family transcriptional repressor of nem operon
MERQPIPKVSRSDARTKILDAAFRVIRQRGYSATTVDDLCREASVTKGAFFHHFRSKDDLGAAAANHWSKVTGELFAGAPYRQRSDPLDRVMAYIDFRRELLRGAVPEFTCLVGTMVQEAYFTAPAIRDACRASIFGHAATLEGDIAEAVEKCGLKPDWTVKSLALHTQAVLQGAFILAKASGGVEAAIEQVDHLRRYFELLFGRSGSSAAGPAIEIERSVS